LDADEREVKIFSACEALRHVKPSPDLQGRPRLAYNGTTLKGLNIVIESEAIKEQLLVLIRQFRGRLAAFSDSQKSEIVAELKQIEEALRESEGRFRLVAQAAHEAVWDLNLLTGEVWRSQGFETLFGYRGQEIDKAAKWWEERIHPEDRERVMNAIPAFMAGNVHPVSFEYRFRRADGSYAYVFDRSFFLTNGEGRPVRMIGAMLDISERKQAEKRQREYTRRLRNLTRQLFLAQENERRRLAQALHDEFAQLLTGLLLRLDLCTHTLAQSRIEDRRSKIEESAASYVDPESSILEPHSSSADSDAGLGEAVKLAHDLMARVRALSLDLRPVILDDMGLLHSLRWHVDNFRQRTGVQVDFQNAGIDGRFSSELESAVYRLVQEALSNVSRHAGVRKARLKVWLDGGELCVEVEDQGIGFDSGTLLETDAYTGLTEARERISLLGGRFALTSKPGKGTRLIVRIPLVLPDSESPSP
jgi:PAS domain S-box-containing protein